MPQYIEIENGLARVVRREVLAESTLEALLPLMETHLPVLTPPLTRAYPTVIAYWDESNPRVKRLQTLTELPPKVRTLHHGGRDRRVPLPYLYFLFEAVTSDTNAATATNWQLEDYRVYMTNTPVTDATSKLWHPCLPNIFNDERICFGSTAPPATQRYGDRVDNIINEFFVSQFNNDLTIYFPAKYGGWTGWTRAASDPFDWVDWPEWTNGQERTLAQILDVERTNRLDPILTNNGIPELPLGMTFGRAEEWLTGLTDSQRAHLLRAFENYRADVPGAFTGTAEPDWNIPEEEDDDA